MPARRPRPSAGRLWQSPNRRPASLDVAFRYEHETAVRSGSPGGCPPTILSSCRPLSSDGYTELWRRHRIDFTVEALVVGDSKWHPLFSAADTRRARARLSDFGYAAG